MAGTNTTQFIFIKHGNTTDEAIDYVNSADTNVTNFATGGPTGTNTGIISPIAIQADLTGGFYYIIDPQLDGNGNADGQIHLGKIATPTVAPTTAYTVPDYNSGVPGDEFSEANAIAIDTTNHVLYLAQVVYTSDLSGLDPQTGIVAFNYNPTTGALSSPTTGIPDTSAPILTRGATGTQQTDANIDEVAQLSLDSTHHVLYFTDDTFGKGFFVGANETNSVKAYDTVTHVETTVVTFPSGSDGNVEFPTGYTNGTIEGVAADPTDNLVFFSTASGFAGSESLNSIYVIAPNGTGQVKLAESPTYDNLAPFNLTFDDVHNKLYVSYESTDPTKPGHLVEYDVNIPTPGSTAGITLSNPVDIGLSLQDPSGSVDYPLTGFLDQLPVLTTTGTATHAVEQGAAITLLAPGTTLTDADQTQLVGATVKITGGTFISNENSTTDDHLGFAAANVTGSLINGTNIHFTYDTASETLTLTGTDSLADYNLALSEVRYSTTGDNPTNYGSDPSRTITWQVNDGAIGNPSGTNTTTTTLNIDAVNDAPVATTPVAHYAATEQVNLSLKNSGLSVSDVDGGIVGQNETVTLSVGEGTLTLAAGTSGAVIDSGNGTNSVTFHGAIAQLNDFLNTNATSTVIYNDNTDPPSASTTLTLQVNDNGNTGTGGPLVGTNTATIDIIASPTLSTTLISDTVTLGPTPVILTDSATLADGLNPTGTITFTLFDGITLVDTETVAVDGNGTYTAPTGFSLPSSGTATGTYQWDASYGGDAHNTTASDVNNPTEQVTVSAASPTLSTTPIPGGTLNDTADLEGAFHPTGSITFTLFHGGTLVDTETVAVNGNGTYTTPTGFAPGVASGTYQWDATYSGDTNNNTASENNNPTEQVNAPSIITSPSPTTVTLATASVILTDTATLAGGLNETGTITFTLFHGSTLVDTETVAVSGDGTYTTPTGFTLPNSGTATGTYQWDASYSGDANNIPTSDVNNLNEQVIVGAANPTLSTTPNPDAVTLGPTAVTLSDTADLEGAFDPTGNIVFTLTGPGGFSYTQTDTVSGNGTYTADVTLPTTGTVDGTYTWTAHYVGDPNNNAANDQGGSSEQVNVSAAHPTLSTTPIPDTVLDSTPVPLKDTADLEGAYHPTGTITFTLFHIGDNTPVDTETVAVNGNGTYTTPTGFTAGIASGTYQWDATYSGDAHNTAASDNNNPNEQVTVGHAPGAFDFNFDPTGDGHSDILLQDSTNGAVSFWDNGQLSGAQTIAESVTSNWHIDGIGDFDGNGKTDILWESDSGSVAIWDNGQIGHTIATGMPSSWHIVGTGDFNGDGKSDILWQNDNGSVAVWDSNNAQTGHTIAGPGSMLPTNEHVVATGDFSGDGITDILWQNTSNGALTLWSGENPATASVIATSMPNSWHVAGIGDFDGNGKSDILWQNDNGSVAIWDNGQIGHTIATGVPSSWHIVGVGDFNGDHKSDILWQNDNGSVAIWDSAQIGHTVAAAGAVSPDWHIIV